MGTKIRELLQTDFSGGVNAVTSPYLLTPKQVARVRNMVLDEHGALSTRYGYSVNSTSPDTTNPIVHHGTLAQTGGTNYDFSVQNDGVKNTVRRSDVSPWTVIGTTGTAYTIPDSATITDKQVFAMGYETPWTWGGPTTAFTQITATAGQTVPPGANHLSFHLGSLWLWNTNSTTTTLDGPSSLRMSDANNINSWPNANQTFVAKDDGQQGMGMSTYTIVETGISPTSTLVLFKNYSGYQVTGVFGSTNFAVQRIKSDMGCVAPRTIQFVSGFGIIRLTHKGFALYNGVDDKIISEEIRPYLFGRDDLSSLNWGNIDRSAAAQVTNPPWYVVACPTSGTALDRVFVYDLVRRAWTVCDFPISFQSLTLHTSGATSPETHAGTATGGQHVRIFNQADTTDSGTAIPWSFRTRTFFVGSPMRPAYWRRVLLNLLFAPDRTVTITTTFDGLSTSKASTVTYTGTPIGALYGSAVYGQSMYFSLTSGTLDGLQSADLMRTAPAAYVTVTGTGTVRVRGLSLHAVAKPLTRQVVTTGAV